jgi:hypothetical protein
VGAGTGVVAAGGSSAEPTGAGLSGGSEKRPDDEDVTKFISAA